jgi:CRP-like cAMP-binding protein
MTAAAERTLPKSLLGLMADYPAVRHRGREVLHREGMRADAVFVLEEGLIKLQRMSGEKELVVRFLRPGDAWGEWTEGGSGARWRATASCLGPARVCAIPAVVFRRACQRDAELAAWMAQTLERRLAEMERRMELMSFYRVEQRLLYSLAELAERCLEGRPANEYALPLTQTDVAGLIGATRETVSTTLNALERRGVLRLRRRSLEFESPEQLRSVAAGV